MLEIINKKKMTLKVSLAKKTIFRDQNYNFRNFFGVDSVAVFPELELCFNRIKKSGNTSVCVYLAQACGYPVEETPERLKENLLRPEKMSLGQLARVKNYHSLAVVRDPFSRALSAFLEKIGSGATQHFAHYPAFGDLTPEGFVIFLKHLSSSSKPGNRHFWPQTDLLYQPPENFTLLAKLEELPDVLPDFVRKISGYELDEALLRQPHPTEGRQKGKITAAKNRKSEFYTEASVELVRQIYSADFKAFGYSDQITL